MDITNTLFLLAGLLLFISVVASTLSARLGVPLLLLFLGVGMLAGEDGPGRIVFNDFHAASMVSQLAPPSKTAEFYGFLSVAGRTSTFIGPLVFGTLSFRMNNWYLNHGVDAVAAEHGGLYWAIGSILLFLVVGLMMLLFVKRVTAKDPILYQDIK